MSGTITISSTDLLNAVYPQLKSQITKEPEVAQQGYSYIIWTDGTNYYAKNGATGQIEFSGIDASTVIQSVFNSLPIGRTSPVAIYLKGSFTNVNVSVPSRVYLFIDGEIHGTLTLNGVYEVTIEGGYIEQVYITGNSFKIRIADTTINTLIGDSGGYWHFDHVSFTTVTLTTNGNEHTYWVWFSQCWIQNPNGNGLYAKNSVYLLVESSVLSYNNSIGVYLEYCLSVFINGDIEANNVSGLVITGGHAILINTSIYGNNNYGIYLGTDASVEIMHSSINGDRTADIKADTGSNTLKIDRFTVVRTIWGINNLQKFISDQPSFLSRNSGVATISTGSISVTVNHGLALTPTKVMITPLGQPSGNLWVSNITSTSFTINISSAPSSNLNVAWYAEV